MVGQVGACLWTYQNNDWGVIWPKAVVVRLWMEEQLLTGGANTHAVRFRTHNSQQRGFVFENNSNQSIFSITGNGRYLEMYSNVSGDGPTLRMKNPDIYSRWEIVANDGTDNSMDFEYSGGIKGYISTSYNDKRMNTFTGQHICDISNISYKESEAYIGLIVSANNDEYVSVNNNVITKGIEAIEVEESVPLVSLTRKEKDKSCFGVISRKENDINRSQSNGSWMTTVERELGDNRIYINSLGEGALWVSNKNGNLESGDYVTTSILPGYGEKQDDDLLHNYTVAKITMNCNFQPSLKSKQIIKRKNVEFYTDASNNTYDMSNNLIRWGSEEPREGYDRKYTIQYYNKTVDVSNNVINVTQNILDANGDLIWEDTQNKSAYRVRHLDPSGDIITEQEYESQDSSQRRGVI